MMRHGRLGRRLQGWLASVLIGSILSLPLSGCGGGGASPPGPTADASGPIQGQAQFLQASAEGDLGIQSSRATSGRVTAYRADGALVGEGALSPAGSFFVTDPAGEARFPERAAGLQPGEIRVVIDLPDGSTLMADSQEPFVHVSPITTILALARKNRPGLTLEQAEAALRAYLDLPDSLSLEDLGGQATPFSEAAFLEAARAWNEANGGAGDDVDAYAEVLEDGVQAQVAGVRSAQAPLRTPLAARALLGVGEDNADPPGSLDPDQHLGAAGEASGFDPANYERAGNLGFANTLVNTAGSGLSEIAAFVLVFDAAAGNNGVSTVARWVGGIGIGVVALQMASSIVLSILQNNQPDPVQEGLRILSGQIQALSQQIAETEAKILFNLELQRTQTRYEELLARLNLAAGLRPPSPAPQPASQVQQASQAFSASPAGILAGTTLADSMLGINGSNNGVRLFHTMLGTRLEFTPAVNQDRMNLPVRSNEILLQARNLPMRYVNMLTSALQVTSEEARVFMNLPGSPAGRIHSLQTTLEEATPAFGQNGLAALRRRGLQQAPPRFSSSEILVDSTRGDAGRGLVWSREIMVRAFDDTTIRRDIIYRTFITHIDGDRFKPGGYRLNDELPAGAGWRLPTLAELRSLPGWGKEGSALATLKAKAGIDVQGRHWFAAWDPSAPATIEVERAGFGTLSVSRTSGQVRFYSFPGGREIEGLDAVRNRNPPDTVSCLRVLDLNMYPGEARPPTSPWPDEPARRPAWWPDVAYRSTLMRSAGIPPTNLAIVDHLIPNPWHSQDPHDPREVPTHVRVLSALAFWELKSVGGQTRGFVEDVSGLVEWQSSNPAAATVWNLFNRFDSAAEAARAQGRFVSPWFAPITFSQADVPVTFTASWSQGLLSSSPSNQVTLTQAADPRICLPPVVCGLDVTPGNLLYTSAAQLTGAPMSATLYRTDRSAQDATNAVEWSLLEVTLDGGGAELTAPFPAALASISQGAGGGTGGLLTVQAGAGSPARTLRVVARDPVSGRTGRADLRLQF